MKVVKDFDQLVLSSLWAVSQDEGPVAELSSNLASEHRKLYEVRLLLSGGTPFADGFPEMAGFSSWQELCDFYDLSLSPNPGHALAIQLKLLAEFATNLCHQDAAFDCSIQKVDDGYVVSVAFGNKAAINLMYERNLRPLPQAVPV